MNIKKINIIEVVLICSIYCLYTEIPIFITPGELNREIHGEIHTKCGDFLAGIERANVTEAAFDARLERCVRDAIARGDLSSFDANVGDSLCEVRASMMADMVAGITMPPSIARDVDVVLKKALFLLKYYNQYRYDENGRLMGDWIDFKIERGEPLGLWPGSKGARDKMRNPTQRFVAACSCEYLHWVAVNLRDEQLQKALALIFCRDGFQRLMPAFYPAVKTIIMHAINVGRPIVVKVKRYCGACAGFHRGCFYYVPDRETGEFIRQDRIEIGKPVLVYECNSFPRELLESGTDRLIRTGLQDIRPIEGCPEVQEFFGAFASHVVAMGGLKTLILADAAQHEQWNFYHESEDKQRKMLCDILSGNGLYELADEIMRMNTIAQEFGCSRQNPTFVLIEHIYTDIVRE